MKPTTYSRGQDLLSDCGKFYLVALAQNNIPEIRERMRKKFNMNSQVRAVLCPTSSLICSRLHYKDEPEESIYSSYAFLGAEIYHDKEKRHTARHNRVHVHDEIEMSKQVEQEIIVSMRST